MENKEADNQKAQWEAKECRQSILRLENIGSVRDALEFIRSKVKISVHICCFCHPVFKFSNFHFHLSVIDFIE